MQKVAKEPADIASSKILFCWSNLLSGLETKTKIYEEIS
jgi:hypothetical protein